MHICITFVAKKTILLTTNYNHTMLCIKCKTKILNGSKFCHCCGSKIVIVINECPKCQKENPSDAPNCFSCDESITSVKRGLRYPNIHITPLVNESFEERHALLNDIWYLFFNELARQVGMLTIREKVYSQVVEYMQVKRFTQVVTKDFDNLIETFTPQSFSDDFARDATKHTIMQTVKSNALYHLIHNCSKQFLIPLNPQILRYSVLSQKDISSGKTPLINVLRDYLQLDKERLRWYDFGEGSTRKEIAFDKLSTAQQAICPAKIDTEKLLMICDTSLFGSFNNGFAITEFGLYFKPCIGAPFRVLWHQIQSIERHKDYIMVNGQFFNVTKSFNVKMWFLLDKLKTVYG